MKRPDSTVRRASGPMRRGGRWLVLAVLSSLLSVPSPAALDCRQGYGAAAHLELPATGSARTALETRIRAEQAGALEKFLKATEKVRADAKYSGTRKLPGGLKAALEGQHGSELGGKMYEAYGELLSLMRDHRRFFLGVQALEREVLIETAERGLEPTPENHHKVLREVLARNEKQLGFKPVVVVRDFLEQKDFMAMLARGEPFDDVELAGTKERKLQEHGALTHRIQLYVWSRVIAEKFPAKSGDPSMPYRLYTELGNTKTVPFLDWKDTGHLGKNQHLWAPLFDSLWTDFTRAEYLRDHHEYWPGLGNWY